MAVAFDTREGRLFLSGAIDFENAQQVSEDGLRCLTTIGGDWVVDVSRLESRSSITVAVMLSWLREANAVGKHLVYRGVSGRLGEIIRVSGLETVIPRENVGEGV